MQLPRGTAVCACHEAGRSELVGAVIGDHEKRLAMARANFGGGGAEESDDVAIEAQLLGHAATYVLQP